jgi:hypothetical protein
VRFKEEISIRNAITKRRQERKKKLSARKKRKTIKRLGD